LFSDKKKKLDLRSATTCNRLTWHPSGASSGQAKTEQLQSVFCTALHACDQTLFSKSP